MPKTPKGELTTAEIRKLIKAHNILTSIKIPKGATRDEIIKIVDKKGYMVNHEKKSLDPKGGIRKGNPRVKLEKAKELTKPKPKTELQKQKASESKAEKAEKKKKEERVIRKKAVEEEKKRTKPKAKPKTASIAVGTEIAKNDKEKPAVKKAEPKKEGPIGLTNAGIQYVARIFASAMDEIMGEKEELKNKQFYFDLQKSQFSGDKLFKFLKSKSKSNEKKRNKIIQSLEWWAKFVGSDFKKKRGIFAIADIDNDPKQIPLGLPWEKYEMGNVNPKELIAIGQLVETFTPYKMVNKYGGMSIENGKEVKEFDSQKFIKN